MITNQERDNMDDIRRTEKFEMWLVRVDIKRGYKNRKPGKRYLAEKRRLCRHYVWKG